ncbi:hypothetical protein ASU33_13695 [Solirubrum puertoriconensis]|uniref:Uncharacterized protein n=1 Tax=Solirubrum puertoriconensis TaxID=1751427 RepID=A0A9X0HKD6_SOLP1|nr:hypothetical protein ASU33_13695 [Solirubrum puertoriconensis]
MQHASGPVGFMLIVNKLESSLRPPASGYVGQLSRGIGSRTYLRFRMKNSKKGKYIPHSLLDTRPIMGSSARMRYYCVDGSAAHGAK